MAVRRVPPVAMEEQRVPGSRATRRARGAAGGRETYSLQYVDRLSGEPARLHAAEAFMNNPG